ncbi:MAG: (d)CMP kinase [Candidatus Nitrohelix vancouverensis]|uniref:Cytidylate kinase n=1 Tax=Candidatus Nitrohelix vancouverensis TaxID=2705534 RepID=A0A7T0C0Z9_9BACT|nr:MAG: (d)CMP kinase [Candidatus Nitrohelix vancouverensis]
MIIAIDGPAGSGKSTAAKTVAQHLNYRYIDTGAMYRAVAWKALQANADLNDQNVIGKIAEELEIELLPQPGGQRVLADGQDITSQLKNETVGGGAAVVAAQKIVRDILVAKQRDFGKNGDIVMDGRDIGTVVFPQADFKFFLEADPEERGRRRYLEMKEKHSEANLPEIIEQVRRRDQEDRNRDISPLRMADDGILLDTTGLNPGQVVEKIISYIEQTATKN